LLWVPEFRERKGSELSASGPNGLLDVVGSSLQHQLKAEIQQVLVEESREERKANLRNFLGIVKLNEKLVENK